jgi:hypothetical protein
MTVEDTLLVIVRFPVTVSVPKCVLLSAAVELAFLVWVLTFESVGVLPLWVGAIEVVADSEDVRPRVVVKPILAEVDHVAVIVNRPVDVAV